MSSSRGDDFPESTLVDDDRAVNGRPNKHAGGRGYGRVSQQHNMNRGLHRPHTGMRQDHWERRRPVHMSTRTTRTPVDIDRAPLVSLGRAMSNKGWGNHSLGNGGDKMTQNETSEGGGTHHPLATQGHGPPSEGGGSQNPRGNTPENSSQGEQSGKHGAGAARSTTFTRYVEPTEAHPQQLRPTASMFNLATALFKRNIEEWKAEDVYTPNSSDGTSVLLSAFVDLAATTFRPDMTQEQCLTLAQLSAVTAPQQLLEMVQDPTKAMRFINWALEPGTSRPPTYEDHLCPILTPGLFTEKENMDMIEDYQLRSDQIHIIETFIRCFYPKTVTIARTHLDPLEAPELSKYIKTPGEIKKGMGRRNQKMAFSPPKWYRLSIHPDAILKPTPRKQRTRQEEWRSIPITLADIQSKLGTPIEALLETTFETQRATILLMAPLAFGDQISREGRLETMRLLDTATPEELRTFLLDGKGTMAHTDDHSAPLKQRQQYHQCLRFEHTERKRDGEWTEPLGSILLKWVNAVHPVLRANDLTLTLSMSPFARVPRDLVVTDMPYTVETMEQHIQVKAKQNAPKPHRFDVWIKSACESWGDMTDSTRSGYLADAYAKAMREAHVHIEILHRLEVGMVPVMLLGGSIETEPNHIALEELKDRLAMTGTRMDDCPSFHLAYTAVSTSTGKPSIMAKCVIAHKDDMGTLHQMFATLTAPSPARTRYLVTRDYSFPRIYHPPDERTDRILGAAIQRQREFIASLTKTTIQGLKGIDPFFDVPNSTRDFSTGTLVPNNKSVAQLILTAKTMDHMDYQIDSPVLRVSTNPKGNKLYLTAPKSEARELVRFSGEVLRLLEVWYEGKFVEATCDSADAQRIAHMMTQQDQPRSFRQGTVRQIREGGEVEEPGREQKTAGQAAPYSITDRFTSGGHQPPATENRYNKVDPGASSYEQVNDLQENTLGHLQNEIGELQKTVMYQQSILTGVHDMVQVIMTRGSLENTSAREIDSTIATSIETNIQSSLTSTSQQALSACESYFSEQRSLLNTFMTDSDLKITKACITAFEKAVIMDTFVNILARSEANMEKTQMAVTEMRDQYAALLHMVADQHSRMTTHPDTMPTSGTDGVEAATADEEGDRMGTTVADDVDSDSGLDEYNKEIRRRARGVLDLMKSMPMRPMPHLEGREETNTVIEPTIKSRVATTTCCECKRDDLGLIFCDRCPEVEKLYHPTCLTFLPESKERLCQYCLHAIREERSTSCKFPPTPTVTKTADTSTMSEMLQTSPRKEIKSPSKDEQRDSSRRKQPSPPILSSSPPSSSSSSSSSSGDSYNPTYQHIPKTGKAKMGRKLPNLAGSTAPTKQDTMVNTTHSTTTRTSARLLKLAAKKEKKLPDDAYDTPDDIGSDMDIGEE